MREYEVLVTVAIKIGVDEVEFQNENRREFTERDAQDDAEFLLANEFQRGMSSGFVHKHEACVVTEAEVRRTQEVFIDVWEVR